MKKIKYILVPVLTGLLFTACENAPKGLAPAELDAKVADKVNARTQQINAECEARVMEAARMRADSFLAAVKTGGKKVTTTPKTSGATTTKNDKTPPTKVTKDPPNRTVQSGGIRSQSDQSKAKDKTSVPGGGLRTQSDASKQENKKKVEGGGLRSQSDQSKEKK